MKELFERISENETLLRHSLYYLRYEMSFEDKIEFDGETFTREDIDKWLMVLEEIDKKVNFV